MAACELIEAEGIGALTIRRVAEAASVSIGAVQFHFADQDELGRDVVRFWAGELSGTFSEKARKGRGLLRTMILCRGWLELPVSMLNSMPSQRRMPSSNDGNAYGMWLQVLGRWIDQTHRSLRQARYLQEVEPGVDLASVAVDLHRLAWSHGWTSALYGRKNSARSILESVHQRLTAIACRPKLLPSLRTLLGTLDEWPEDPPRPKDAQVDPPNAPAWRWLLDPTDPQFHAFERHEILDDPRDLSDPPSVLPEDIEAARAYASTHSTVAPTASAPPAPERCSPPPASPPAG